MKLRINTEQFYVLLIALPSIFLLVFYVLPVLNVLLLSVSDPQPGLKNYQSIFENTTLHRVFWNTAKISILTTIITVAMGYMVSFGLINMRERERNIVLLVVLASFWLSALIRAYAWIAILGTSGLINETLSALGVVERPLQMVRNELGVVIGMVHYMIPYAVLPLYANMSGIDMTTTRAARALGATKWRSFWWVFFPQSMPGVAGASILVFIFSLGFYITPAVLGGGRVVMLAQYIAQQISETLRWGLAATLSTVLVLVVLVLTVWMSRYLRQGSTLGIGGR